MAARIPLRVALLAAIALVALSTQAQAQNLWTGAVSDDWFTDSNWTLGVPDDLVPTSVDTVAPNSAVLSLQDTVTQSVTIGQSATGQLAIQNGGTLANTGFGIVGRDFGSQGTVTVTGVGSAWTNTQGLLVGQFGSGTLRLEAGGTVSNALNAFIGQVSGSQGAVTVTGLGSRWTSTANMLIVGDSGAGTLTIEDRGVVDNNFLNANAVVGNQPGSVGTVVVTGADSVWITRLLTVAARGTGILRIENGGLVDITQAATNKDQEYLFIGSGLEGTPGNGLVRVTGPGSRLLVGEGQFHVGAGFSDGRLEILDGGVVEKSGVAGGTSPMIGLSGGTGTVLIDGADSLWRIRGNASDAALFVGSGAGAGGPVPRLPSGTLTLANGGRLVIDPASIRPVIVTADFNARGEIVIGAAAGDAAVAPGHIEGASSIIHNQFPNPGVPVPESFLTFNHTAAVADNYVFAPALIGNITVDFHAGATILTGNSITALGGGASGYTGAATVHDGATAIVDGVFGGMAGDGHVEVLGGGMLGGSGTLRHVTVASGGRLAPGSSPGILTVTGNLVLQPGAILDFELGAPDAPGVGSDLIVVGGDLTLNGTLNVADAGGFGNGLYRLFDYGGGLSGGGLGFGTLPAGFVPADLELQTAVAGQVNLLVGPLAPPGLFTFWDGEDASANDVIGGGSGLWNATDTNWTDSAGAVNGSYDPDGLLIFAAPGGTVTVDASGGALPVAGLQFAADGYLVEGDGLELAAPVTTIRVGDGTAAGAGFIASIASALSGEGLVKEDLGTLALMGQSTLTGDATVAGGTLAIVSGGTLTNAEGFIGFSGGSVGMATVSGSGSTWANTGTLQVGNLGTGTLIVENGGTLTNTEGFIGSGDGADGSVTVSGPGSTWTNSSFLEVGRDGTGMLTVADGGLVVATGGIDLGLFDFSTGTLNVGAGADQAATGAGAFDAPELRFGAGAATLIFNHTGTSHPFGTTLVSAGPGTHAIAHLAGTTVLTGDGSSFAGATTVSGGTLRVDDVLGGTLLIEGAGRLTGTGTVGQTTLGAGGTIAPGNSIGTLHVAGNVVFNAGSIYEIEIEAPDRADLISATGTVTINGGALAITALDTGTSYADGQTYRIVEAAGGVFHDGDFTSNQAVSLMRTEVIYGADFVDLLLVADIPFITFAQTYNQSQAATGLQDFEQGGDALTVFNEIVQLSLTPGDGEAVRRGFDLSSGEIHASGRHVTNQTFGLFSRTLRHQGAAGVGATEASERVPQAWVVPLGQYGRVDADGNAATLDGSSLGLAGGFEAPLGVAAGRAHVGFGLGYIRGLGSVPARLSSMNADGIHIGAYGGWADGPWRLAGALAFAINSIATERRIAFGGIDRTATADYWSRTVGFSGEVLYGFDLGGGTTISPLFALDIGWSSHGGFTETGAGALDLTGASETWARLDTGLGVALNHVIPTERGQLAFDGRLVWEHAFADVVPSQNLAFAGSPTEFDVRGPDAGNDRLRLGVGLSFQAAEDLILRTRYDAVFSGNQQNHTASVGLNVQF